ncbi:unnamed protein product, partial [Choristocarpus tenellus]
CKGRDVQNRDNGDGSPEDGVDSVDYGKTPTVPRYCEDITNAMTERNPAATTTTPVEVAKTAAGTSFYPSCGRLGCERLLNPGSSKAG